MKKNNFFIVALLGAGVLSGVSFEARGMDAGSVVLAGTGIGVGVWYCIKNTKTYETYEQHRKRLAEEKEVFDNPLLHAQPLESLELVKEAMPVERKIAEYEKQQKKNYDAFLSKKMEEERPRVTIKDSWANALVIDSYERSVK